MGQEVIIVEVHGWLAELLDPGAGNVLTLPLPPDATLGIALAAVTEGHPGQLSEIRGHLEQRLAGGSRVVLLPAYAGGWSREQDRGCDQPTVRQRAVGLFCIPVLFQVKSWFIMENLDSRR